VTLAVVDNYLDKTRRSLEESPPVSFMAYVEETHRSHQIKGLAEIATSGDIFMEVRGGRIPVRGRGGLSWSSGSRKHTTPPPEKKRINTTSSR